MAAVPDSWVATGAIGGVGVVGVVGRGCVVLSSLPPPHAASPRLATADRRRVRRSEPNALVKTVFFTEKTS